MQLTRQQIMSDLDPSGALGQGAGAAGMALAQRERNKRYDADVLSL